MTFFHLNRWIVHIIDFITPVPNDERSKVSLGYDIGKPYEHKEIYKQEESHEHTLIF